MSEVPPSESLNRSKSALKIVAQSHHVRFIQCRPTEDKPRVATAIVYCEGDFGDFGDFDGKTANGLIRCSEKYRILSVIDSKKAGLDTGMVLDNKPNAIPICRDLDDSLAQAESAPGFYIFGMAPSNGMLSKYERGLGKQSKGCHTDAITLCT